jgi:hypothetical protein
MDSNLSRSATAGETPLLDVPWLEGERPFHGVTRARA